MTNPDPGAAFADVAYQLGRYQDSLRERDQALQQVSDMRVEFASADGAVQVAVNSEGFLLGLQLAPSVSGLPSDQIADLILHVYNAAQQSAASKATELIQSTFGGAGGSVADKYRWRFEHEAPANPEIAAAGSEHSDDDYDQATTFRA